MKVLIDTHALLWAAFSPRDLTRKAAEILSDRSNEILVSAASAWEIATKVRLGRLPEAERFERNFLDYLRVNGYGLRTITVEDALRAGRLLGNRQDPFDRMLSAQALNDDVPVISADEKLDEFQVRRIW